MIPKPLLILCAALLSLTLRAHAQTSTVVFDPLTGKLLHPTAPNFYSANPPPTNDPLTITSVGDGASSSLELVPTTALTTPVSRTVYLTTSGELQDWLLVAATDATVAGQKQRPADYNDSTNTKVWVRKR